MAGMDAVDTRQFEAAVDLLAGARYAVALTGAGISKESGIPTFRGEGGLWTIRGEPPLDQYQTFVGDPARWWERRLEEQAGPPEEFALALHAAEPNAGHRALVDLEAAGVLRHVITQNVDDLHRRAGHQSLTEIHGNMHWMRCMDCHQRWPRAEVIVDPASLPPRCSQCRGVVKGDGVMFGEPIPPYALRRCAEETERADVFLIIGTTAMVYPAAMYPQLAVQRGVPLIEIDPEPTALTQDATVVLRGRAGDLLPGLVSAVTARRATASA